MAGEGAAVFALIGTAIGLIWLYAKIPQEKGNLLSGLKPLLLALSFIFVISSIYVGSVVMDYSDGISGNLNMSGNNITDVNWLYVHNISGYSPVQFQSDIVTTENIFAGYLHGDGSNLTGVIGGSGISFAQGDAAWTNNTRLQGNLSLINDTTGAMLAGNLSDYRKKTDSINFTNLTQLPAACDTGTAYTNLASGGTCTAFLQSSALANYWTKGETGNILQENLTLVNSTTGAMISGNNTFAANYSTFLTHIDWTKAANGTLLRVTDGYITENAQWAKNLNGTLAVAANYFDKNAYWLTINNGTIGAWITGNASAAASPKVIGYDTQNNISYYVIDGSSMTLTVASIQRITTAPTINTTHLQPDAYNFPTAGSVGGDGGFVLAGNAANTGTATFDPRLMTYFRICGQNLLTANRRDMIGVFKTGTTVVMNSSLTGILFTDNTTADGNLYARVCKVGTCTTSASLGAIPTALTCYEITDNGATWNFWINGVSVANLSNANEPTAMTATAGWWIESTDATADNSVIRIASARMEGWRS